MGDFNIHMDDPEDSYTITFNDLLDSMDLTNLVNFRKIFLDSMDLTNLVNFRTHISNHTLDLVIQSNSFKVNSKTLQGHFLLDHAFIHHTLKVELDLLPTHMVNNQK